MMPMVLLNVTMVMFVAMLAWVTCLHCKTEKQADTKYNSEGFPGHRLAPFSASREGNLLPANNPTRCH